MSVPKVFAFDFDGVILDSAEVKASVYVEIFGRYPKYAEEMMMYNRRNASISRYVQFRYFYEEVMGLEYTKEDEESVVGEFAKKALERVLAAPFINGAMDFVSLCSREGAKTYVVTGTPHEEILYITEKRGIKGEFDGIYGSPALKENILGQLLEINRINPGELMFFGDAMSDYESAISSGVRFTGVGSFTKFPEGVKTIPDFVGAEPGDF